MNSFRGVLNHAFLEGFDFGCVTKEPNLRTIIYKYYRYTGCGMEADFASRLTTKYIDEFVSTVLTGEEH